MRKAVVFPLLTTMLLFFGPLVQQLGVNSFKERYSEPYSMDPAMWRDLVVAPLTEEFIFRCLTTAILLRMVRCCRRSSHNLSGAAVIDSSVQLSCFEADMQPLKDLLPWCQCRQRKLLTINKVAQACKMQHT